MHFLVDFGVAGWSPDGRDLLFFEAEFVAVVGVRVAPYCERCCFGGQFVLDDGEGRVVDQRGASVEDLARGFQRHDVADGTFLCERVWSLLSRSDFEDLSMAFIFCRDQQNFPITAPGDGRRAAIPASLRSDKIMLARCF